MRRPQKPGPNLLAFHCWSSCRPAAHPFARVRRSIDRRRNHGWPPAFPPAAASFASSTTASFASGTSRRLLRLQQPRVSSLLLPASFRSLSLVSRETTFQFLYASRVQDFRLQRKPSENSGICSIPCALDRIPVCSGSIICPLFGFSFSPMSFATC
jgi:hypothetical protein